jgi:uncharacterized protein YihD (DUF1040 family)
MRNPNRIDSTLKAIGKYWKKDPDWRLGQLISNCISESNLFFIEDDDFVALIKYRFDDQNRDQETPQTTYDVLSHHYTAVGSLEELEEIKKSGKFDPKTTYVIFPSSN